MDIFIGRQPILDMALHTVAYELLYRSGSSNAFPGIDGTEATSSLIHNTFCSMDMSEIVGDKKAFINFTKDMLLSGLPEFDPDQVVVEILEDIIVDTPLIEACKTLVSKSFTLALDDFIFERQFEPLLSLASIVKVDWRISSVDEISELQKVLDNYDVALLAEKIETFEEFKQSKELGFIYFQGYFFARPEIFKTRDFPASTSTYLEIMVTLQSPELDMNEIAGIVNRDPSLCYKLLRIINSAAIGMPREISSIHQALVLLGENETRRWLSILVMSRISEDKPRELVVTACLRARFGERLAESSNISGISSMVFLMGILSLMDAMMERPLEILLENLPLDQYISQALLHRKGSLSPYLDIMVAYERADKTQIKECCEVLGLNQEEMARCYMDALKWVVKYLPAVLGE